MTPGISAEGLRGLAARVEALSGPDREVDALIGQLQGLRVVEEGHPLGRCCYDTNGIAVVLPRFTASLDAAMTLVPAGLRWCVDTCDGKPRSFIEPRRPYEGRPWWGNADTPALALTAAALRAQALSVTGKGEG